VLSGGQEEIGAALAAQLGPEAVGEVCCLGRCYENRAFQCHGHTFSGETADAVAAIATAADATSATATRARQTPPRPYTVEAHLPVPMLAAAPPDPSALSRELTAVLAKSPDAVLEALKASGLRGRGGAGFSVWAKWSACRAAVGTPKYVVCNADEGDPGAYTDRYLLEQQTHAVLVGMLVAGHVVGAQTGLVYVREEYPEAVAKVQEAVAELTAAGMAGEHILGSDFSFHFHIVVGAGAYVCGEETSLLASIEGLRPEVRTRPPYPTAEGLFDRPTVVNNVETLACARLVATQGAEAFASVGTEASRGPKLASLAGLFNKPGVYEVALGTPLSTIINDLGAGFRVPVKAVQIGGPLGCLVPRGMWDQVAYDFESLQQHGFLLGHGSIVAVPEAFPMSRFLEHLFAFAARESCGKCFPCRHGTHQGHDMLAGVTTGKAPAVPRQVLDDLLDTLELGSLCGLGAGVVLPVRNALEHFADELRPCFAPPGQS
jgi:NADH-quinone oxidoreductase subunit F